MKYFLAVGDHCWGNGETVDQAIKNAEEAGSPFKEGFDVYSAEGEDIEPPYLDELGRVYAADNFHHVQGPNYLGIEGE